MELTEFIAATLAVIAGSVVQVASGVGGGFIIVPLLAWLDIGLVPAPLLFASLSLSGLMAAREWHAVDWRQVPFILGGLVPGSIFGAWILVSVPLDELGIVFGCVILLAIIVTASGWHIPLNRVTSALTGALSGAMGTSSGIGAAPMALLYQDQPRAQIRATLAVLYTGGTLIMLAILFSFGKFGIAGMRSGLLLVPGFVLGYWLANRWTPDVASGQARIAVLIVSGAAAIALIVRSFGVGPI
jgi:uncharacterized membrane protein YfcA